YSERLHQGSGGHRQDSILRSVNGTSMYHFSSALTGQGGIPTTARIAACYAGVTHVSEHVLPMSLVYTPPRKRGIRATSEAKEG
ncbi:MAG: hypothetical protein ABW100_19670, partial [Candidatus Thiodiazotropha sp. 6PLUC3]